MRYGALVLALAGAVLCGGCGEGSGTSAADTDEGKGAEDAKDTKPPGGSPAPPAPAPASPGGGGKLLDGLTVREPGGMDGYSRDRFPHWSGQRGSCDTRETVLKRDGEGVRTDRACKAVSGSWRSPYDGATWPEASDVDIDHMVPLAEAWRSGAREWNDDRREALANDLDRPQLLAVTDNVNQAKGDSPPDEWKPALKGYWCTYAEDWIAVKHHYKLSVTTAEQGALRGMLERCTR